MRKNPFRFIRTKVYRTVFSTNDYLLAEMRVEMEFVVLAVIIGLFVGLIKGLLIAVVAGTFIGVVIGLLIGVKIAFMITNQFGESYDDQFYWLQQLDESDNTAAMPL